MQAIILAAGMGRRLKEFTQNNTKCMVKVNGVTLIDRMLHQIDGLHLSKVVIVVGYEGQKLIDYIATLDINTPIIYINNPIYDKTNNIYSLSLAKDWLCKEDTLLFESDLIFEEAVLKTLVEDTRDTLALVDKYESWMDGTCVKLAKDDSIEAFVPGKQFRFNEIKEYYKTVNIYKFSKHFSETYYVPFLDAYSKALGDNEYYEQVLRVVTTILDEPEIKAKRLNGELWYEIDDIQDLDIAASMFAPDDNEKVRLMQKRFGGYWRYPQVLDFCYLVNPYFPPQKMIDEIKASFDTLLTHYPSGMEVNSLLAAKNFNLHQENIMVGNGAAELIKALLSCLNGKTGFVRTTFEGYTIRYNEENSVIFTPNNKDFTYTVQDIIDFFDKSEIENLVIVNPDNPSGNYLAKKDILNLLDWVKETNITLILDESFVDFAEEETPSVMEQSILDNNPLLFIVKSISESYGIPGLRLGVLASGNKEAIRILKKETIIWNINSFAEFYMQIEEKYKKDYIEGLNKYRRERRRLQNKLEEISEIRVIPSQANYIMVELTGKITSRELTKKLFLKHKILIKDLSDKIKLGQYIRFAVRNEDDNNKLIGALREEFEGYTFQNL